MKRALAGLAAIAVSGLSHAAILNFSIIGTVTQENDGGGIFKSDLVGKPFKISYAVDDTKGEGGFDGTSLPYYRDGYLAQNPLTATLTAGDFSFTFGNTAYGSIRSVVPFTSSGFGKGNNFYEFYNDVTTNDGSPDDYQILTQLIYRKTSETQSVYQFFVYNFSQKPSSLLTLSAEVPLLSGVPEPATWLTFISGFGLIGFSIRSSMRKPRPNDSFRARL